MISEDAVKLLNSNTYTFGEFRFEAENLLLLRNSEVVPLPPKACEVLLTLIESDGKLITKQEILDKVWADTFVEEANLTHHISALRKALSEDKNGRKFIETIPRRGYRFVAEVKNAANSERAEITIVERAAVRTVEETTFETSDLRDTATTFSPALVGRNSTGKKRRWWIWTFAAAASVLLVGAAVFGGWRYWRGANQFLTVALPGVVFQPFASDADSYAPSISPDGANVVFARVENEQEILWRKSVSGGQLTQLLPAAPLKEGKIFSTRFSPDGHWVYYKKNVEREGYRNIYRIPAGGGTPQKILNNVDTDFSISPDGTQIAFMRDWRMLIVAETETGVERKVVEVDGMKKGVSSYVNSSAAWSPDGKRLMYAGWVYKYYRNYQYLFEIELATGAQSEIPIDADIGNVGQIEYLPDGSGFLVTHAFGTQDPYLIWFGSFQTGKVALVSNQTDNYKSIRLAADGKTLIAEKSFSNYNIWTASAGNLEQKRQITVGATGKRGRHGLILMPDGKIIYTSLENGRNDLWQMDTDGGNRRQLTVNAGNNDEPRLTREGRYLVFRSNRSGTNQIWRMDADGRNPVQLSKGIENWIYSLSPENDVYYATLLPDGQQYQLFKIPVEGGEPVEVTDRYYRYAPEFSPDGKLMLYWGAKTKDDALQYAVIDRAAGNLVLNVSNAEKSRWSADSKSIYYVNESNGQLFQMPVAGGEPQQITNFYPLSIAAYSFSPDEKNIVFSLGETTGELVLIKNFSEPPK